MATFSVETQLYSLSRFTQKDIGVGWVLDPCRALLLVHDFLPYYLNVLPGKLRVELEKNVREVMAWADAHGIPLVFSVPRPAEIVEQRGVGGHLWGRGPSAVDIEQSFLWL